MAQLVECTMLDRVIKRSILVKLSRVRRHDGDRLWITDGMVAVGDEVFDNMVPMVFSADGDARLVFSGGVLEVVGVGVRVEVTGEATFVEDLPGS